VDQGINFDMSTLSVNIGNILNLTNGTIDATGGGKLTLGLGLASPGTLNYGTGNIYGPFERWINSASTILFPVGDKQFPPIIRLLLLLTRLLPEVLLYLNLKPVIPV